MEQKFYDLDVKVTEIQSIVEQLQDDMQERKGKTTTDAFARVPRAQRSATVPVTGTRATSSAPATAPTAPVQQLQYQLLQLRLHQLKSSSKEPSLHHHLKIKPESRSSTMHFL